MYKHTRSEDLEIIFGHFQIQPSLPTKKLYAEEHKYLWFNQEPHY